MRSGTFGLGAGTRPDSSPPFGAPVVTVREFALNVVVEDVLLVLSCSGCPYSEVSDTTKSDRSLPGLPSRTGHTVIGDEEPAVFEAMPMFE